MNARKIISYCLHTLGMYLSIKIIWINSISYTSLDTYTFETLEDVIGVSLAVIATHVAATQPLINAPNICKCSAIHTVRF